MLAVMEGTIYICFDVDKDEMINILDDYETGTRVDGEIIRELHVSHSGNHQAISHRSGSTNLKTVKMDGRQFVDPLSGFDKISIETEDQYRIEISKGSVSILDFTHDAYTNTTYTFQNASYFFVGSTYVSIESRAEPLDYVNMEAFEFSIAVKERKHSLKFYVDRLPLRENFGVLLDFGFIASI